MDHIFGKLIRDRADLEQGYFRAFLKKDARVLVAQGPEFEMKTLLLKADRPMSVLLFTEINGKRS